MPAYLLGLITIPVLGAVILLLAAALSTKKVGWDACERCAAAGFTSAELKIEDHRNVVLWALEFKHELICLFSVRHRKALQAWYNEQHAKGWLTPKLASGERRYGWRKTSTTGAPSPAAR